MADKHLVYLTQVLEAKPNPMFSEAQRAMVRFLRYSSSVPCAECGKKRKTHWTMLCMFKALEFAAFAPKDSGKIHLPMAPVCRDHLLAPEEVE